MGRRYRLTARLEEGALAELYKASVEGAGGAEVLVKLFNPRMSDPAYARALADISARALALGHPQAVSYEEVGTARGRLAAVRPHFEGYNLGEALRRLMSKEVVLPPALALFLVAEAAQIVAAAHAKGWAHGAITPGNILLGFDGKVRVADFGALEAMSASAPLKALASKGRHAYRAPEQRDPGAGRPVGDVYSLGAIAYELLTLREVAQSRGGGLSTKRDALPSPSRVDRRLNARIDPVIMRALDLAPTRRYRTATDLAEALRGLFSVLGYAPGDGEMVRFVKEIFPNEVTLGAIGGELPINEPFELEQVFSTEQSSGLAVPAELQERSPFTRTQLREEEPTPAPTPSPAPQQAPAAAKAVAPSLEEWEAPPGVMPEAPRLARKQSRQAADGMPGAPHDTPAGDEPAVQVSSSLLRTSGSHDTAEQRIAVQGAGEEEDSGLSTKNRASTAHDWHIPPAPPEPKPKPARVGFGVWMAGIVVCACVAAFAYLAVARKGGEGSLDAIEPPKIDLAATPLQPSEETPEPEPTKATGAQPRPEPAARALLTVEADVPATVFIDGKDIGKTLPLERHSLPAGRHTVLLVYGDTMRELTLTLKPGEDQKRVESLGGGVKPDAGETPAAKTGTTRTRTRPATKKAPRRGSH